MSQSEDVSSHQKRAQNERLILASVVVAIGVVFLLPCLFERNIVAYYSKELISDLASLIPAALSRYRIWLIGATLLFAIVSEKILRLDADMKFKDRIGYTALFALMIDTLILTRTWQFPYCIDDAYIIFRYADNMLRFGAPDFDIGTHVNTVSSQLHFLLLVVTGFISGQRYMPLISESINLIEDIASLVVLYALLKSAFGKTKLAFYGCAMHVLSAYAILEVVRGKEGSLVALLLYLLLWAQVSLRSNTAAWASTLLFLARPEGLILTGMSFLSDAVKRASKPAEVLKSWVPPFLLVGAVFLSILLYYGTVTPQGVLAKSVIYHAPAMLCPSLIFAQLCASLLGSPFCPPSGLIGVLLLLVIYSIIVLVLWRYSFLRVYLCSMLFITIFFCAGNSLVNAFPWYLSWWAPVPPLFYVAVLKRLQEVERTSFITVIAKPLLVSLTLIVVPWHSYFHFPTFSRVINPLPIFYWDNLADRLRVYEVAREYLNKTARKTDTVAVVEVGVIGYGYDGKIFDLLGLVSPDALKLYPVPQDQRAHCGLSIPPQYARLYKPERMLFLDCFGRNGLLKDDYFNKNYQMEWFWKNDAFDSVGVYLYKKTTAGPSGQQ